jgi:hypothetical protein
LQVYPEIVSYGLFGVFQQRTLGVAGKVIVSKSLWWDMSVTVQGCMSVRCVHAALEYPWLRVLVQQALRLYSQAVH